MASSTQNRSSQRKNEMLPVRELAQVRACATPSQHCVLYGSRKRRHPAHIRATRRSSCQRPPARRQSESCLHLRQPRVTSLSEHPPRFQRKFRVRLLFEQSFNARQRTEGCCGSRLNRFIGARKIIPSQKLNIWAKDKICVALPSFELVLLRRANCAGDHLKNICRRYAMAILHANGNRNHGSRAELACGVRWNRRHKAAICKTPRANLHRFEQAGEGAACPNRVHQVSLGEDYWLA